MKVKDLIAQLQKAPADADVAFYDIKTNQFLDIQHVEGGRNAGRTLCVVGEATMKVKCWARDNLKAHGQPKGDLDALFDSLFSRKPPA